MNKTAPDFSMISFLAATWGKTMLPVVKPLSDVWQGEIFPSLHHPDKQLVFTAPLGALWYSITIPLFLLQDSYSLRNRRRSHLTALNLLQKSMEQED